MAPRQPLYALLTCALLLPGANADERLPAWLRPDADRPHAIFDAWKELSTREATICLGENWQMLGGRLQDERGEPLRNTPIHIEHINTIRGYGVKLRTDDEGYFIIYAPYSLDLGPRDSAVPDIIQGNFVTAAPGYPPSSIGWSFAYMRQGIRRCQPELLMRDEDRAFYVLTCEGRSTFDADEFAVFEREYLEREPAPRTPFRDKPRDPEGTPDGRIVRHYEVQIVDETEKPVADAIVKYQFSGIQPGCYQVRLTDAEGRCRLEEWLLPRQAAGDERPGDYINRRLTVDAPGLGVGPVPCDLKPGEVNIIRIAKPAVVTGRVIDHAGKPLASRLRISYQRPSHVFFETSFVTRPDGTFQFDRVMPGEEFVVVSDGFDFRWHQRPGARSEWMSLQPGEVGGGSVVQVPLASALRGVVVDEEGRPVDVGDRGYRLSLDYGGSRQNYVGTANGPWGPRDGGRFGFYGLGSEPFSIRIAAPGFEVEPAEPIQLKPGEMRFVRVTLKRSKGK